MNKPTPSNTATTKRMPTVAAAADPRTKETVRMPAVDSLSTGSARREN